MNVAGGVIPAPDANRCTLKSPATLVAVVHGELPTTLTVHDGFVTPTVSDVAPGRVSTDDGPA